MKGPSIWFQVVRVKDSNCFCAPLVPPHKWPSYKNSTGPDLIDAQLLFLCGDESVQKQIG
uniref:Uncharacterized protein n=1 Tax=Anguilla anguilla TaxID=7936 RepID=A0A0E9RU29_ANGAN